MPERSKFARHVMRTRAGLHNHRARMERGEEFDQLLTAYFLAKHCFAVSVLPMQVKGVFAQIDPNQRYIFHHGLQSRIHVAKPNALGGWG